MSNSSRHPAVTTATSALVLTALMGAGALPAAAASNHTVVPGDTLSGIAAKHGLSLSTVFAANGMGMNTIIYPGQSIRLDTAEAPAASPVPGTKAPAAAAVHTVVPGDTLSGIAAKHGLSLSTVFAANGMGMNTIIYPGQAINLGTPAAAPVIASPAPVQAPAPSFTTRAYTVVSGDTMTGIAAKHGVSLSSLLQANSMQASAIIYVGQRVSVPGQQAAPAPVQPPAPSPAPVSGASIQDQVRATAAALNVDPVLALAVAYQESGFQQHVVSSAGAIGTMQVMPGSGTWASELVGRPLNLNVAADNITAGVAILKALVRTSPNLDDAIASYYQGQYSVQTIGYYDDTKDYVASVKAHMARFR